MNSPPSYQLYYNSKVLERFFGSVSNFIIEKITSEEMRDEDDN